MQWRRPHTPLRCRWNTWYRGAEVPVSRSTLHPRWGKIYEVYDKYDDGLGQCGQHFVKRLREAEKKSIAIVRLGRRTHIFEWKTKTMPFTRHLTRCRVKAKSCPFVVTVFSWPRDGSCTGKNIKNKYGKSKQRVSSSRFSLRTIFTRFSGDSVDIKFYINF